MALSITLRPFQNKAVCHLLENLREMNEAWKGDGSLSWTCLKAPTGAGKTVMAAAAIDELLYPKKGSLFLDENPVILWVCEKSLLLQSREKLDCLLESDMPGGATEIVSEASLKSGAGFKRRKVYFLETQLLGKRRRISSETEENGGLTFWKILENTVSQKIPIYCFIDEAHRGFNTKPSKLTVRGQIIREIPFVVGISATEDNFVSSMLATKRLPFPANLEAPGAPGVVEVRPEEVRESGLLKEYIDLYVPTKGAAGEDKYGPYLLKALEYFKKSKEAWGDYCSGHKLEKGPVMPLLVIQLESRSLADTSGIEERARIGEIVSVIKTQLPNLPEGAFAHVLSDTPDLHVSGETVSHIHPEQVQACRSVQVLFAKEAISNGWDCPRAEVLFSRARRRDSTYIAQFLGRMVRTPLGRTVQGKRELNSVSAVLPDYDVKTVQDVIGYLTGNSAEGEENVTTNPVYIPLADPSRNSDSTFTPEIWKGIMRAVRNIKIPVDPKKPRSPFHLLQDTVSLIAESSELAALQYPVDGKNLNESFADRVLSTSKESKVKREKFLREYLQTGGYKVTQTVKTGNIKSELESFMAATAEDIYREALSTKNVFTKDLVMTFLRENSDIESEKDLIFAGKNKDTLKDMSDWAQKRQQGLWKDFADAVYFDELSPSGKNKYRDIAAEVEGASGEPEFQPFRLNDSMSENPGDRGFEKCLYQGEGGIAHLHLNGLEQRCLEHYLSLEDTVAFFRNPPRGSGAFGILEENGSRFYPDFICFEVRHDEIRPYVVDPHGPYEDSLSRMKSVVKYLKENPGVFSAWFAIDGEENHINLLLPDMQEKVEKATSAQALYLY